MTHHPRIKLIALCVGAALAQLAATAAHADSGTGTDSVLANANNPKYGLYRAADPDGLGQAEYSRSPTGFLYLPPFAPQDWNKSASNWRYRGSFEAGYVGGNANEQAAYFRTYSDPRNGVLLNNFSLEAEDPAAALFFSFQGANPGRKDQFYGLEFGRYNDWKGKLFYNETPHVFTSSYKSFFDGVGTGNLSLPASIPAAGGASPNGTNFNSTAYSLTNATQANINAAAAAALSNAVIGASESTLSLTREKIGARFDWTVSENWKAFASLTDELRKGARPFGATWGGGGGNGNIEIAEPIDYKTYDFAGGVQYADQLSAFNATLSASLFRNDIKTLSFQNPFLPATANGVNGSLLGSGTFALAPDNDFYNAKAEYSRRLPSLMNGRFTGVVSLSSMRQNSSLIPATTLAGVAVPNGSYAPDGSWNSASSLSQGSANAKIDTRLVDLGLSVKPTSALDVKGKLRYYETDNSSGYLACNPTTGQFGRLLNDGTGSAMVTYLQANGAALTAAQQGAVGTFLGGNGCNADALSTYLNANGLVPGAGNNNIRSVPYEYKQWVYGLSGDYRIARSQSLNFGWEREEFNRQYRERDKTWEDKFKVTYVNRAIGRGTLRVSAEMDRRRGSDYNPDPYDYFYSGSLGGTPTATGSTANMSSWIHTNQQFRKYDLADRNQSILNLRLNQAIAEDLDGGVSVQWKDVKYPNSDLGRNGHQSQSMVNLDLNWQPNADLSVYGFFSFREASLKQNSVWSNACVLGNTYTFWSNGVVNTGAAVAGATPVGTTTVTSGNWQSACGNAGAMNPLYPSSRQWQMDQKDRNNTVGLGLKYDFRVARVNFDYTFTQGTTSVNYGGTMAAMGLSAAQTAAAGAGWPDMTFSQSTLNANVLIPVNKATTVRLQWLYEIGKVNDWHYTGVAGNPTAGAGTAYNVNNLYLDTGPRGYTSSVIGAFVKMDL